MCLTHLTVRYVYTGMYWSKWEILLQKPVEVIPAEPWEVRDADHFYPSINHYCWNSRDFVKFTFHLDFLITQADVTHA
jgi:hypothetical protein